MTKKEIISEVRSVVSGMSGHTHIIFGKINGKWEMNTNINSHHIHLNDFSDWDWITERKHNRNSMTVEEAKNEVEEAEQHSKTLISLCGGM